MHRLPALPAPPCKTNPGNNLMDMLEGIATRRSIRGFKPTPIARETLEQLFKTASRSASYKNTQPWEVAVVTGKKRDELSKILLDLASRNVPQNHDEAAPKLYPDALEERSRIHNKNRFAAIGLGRDDAQGREKARLLNFEFFGAPCAVFVFMDKALTHWSTFDLGLFTETLTLAAHGMGLGTCLQASVTGYPDAIRNCLGISNDKTLVISLSLGYPDFDAPLNAYHSAREPNEKFVTYYD